MSQVLGRLCGQVAGDAFGPVVQSVVQYLFTAGSRPLPAVIVNSPYQRNEVKLALQVLLQHHMVTFSVTRTSMVEYTLHPDRVLLLLRYARFLLLIKTRFGVEQEVILDELLRQGQDSAFQLVVRVTKRINESLEEGGKRVQPSTIRDKFCELVRGHYLQRCACLAPPPDPSAPPPAEDAPPPPPVVEGVPPLVEPEGERAFMPPAQLDMGAVQRAVDGRPGRPPPDDPVRWRVNFSRLDEEFRDQLVLNSVSRTCGEPAADVMRHLMALAAQTSRPWSPECGPVALTELKDRLTRLSNSVHADAVRYCEQYVRIMSEGETPYLVRFGDAGGGQYTLNMKRVMQNFGWAVAENVVQERFGSRAGRIFRLIRSKRYIEQDKIHEWAMIPPKEAKLLTYQLHQATFVSVCDLRKPGQQVAPGRLVFLFHLDFNHLTRMLIETCYRALLNMLTSRAAEASRHQRLYDKQQRVETLLATMRQQGVDDDQIAEVEEALTEPERAELARAAAVTDRLSLAETQLDQTLFLLQTCLRYSAMK
ncbi:DNA-directed RNA polymerase III subunit RPC3-like [Amphibalanus amphitrite]|uniref:DNA-directed RNA polymerase III subunit RPC3-like n=1 Tax=Amphibalanus amphitrite TaxID=1232801 RepID=UPI001C902473|nr:DNA-directed RNA polymerase III subunit RPC3-like [Amphibalanus amphitrite]XP_043236108.1 DNA-directed RNA polymerase III subunit RPC3-like [Amphibalanus amphitrite]